MAAPVCSLEGFCWRSSVYRRRASGYHKRLTYVLADHSEPMLDDASRAGVFPRHCSVAFARADAVQQQFEAVQGDVPDGTHFVAIFLNYLLDCLPATVLRRHGDAVEQLCVQTELPPGNRLFRDLPGAQDRAIGYSTGTNSDRSGLIDLYPIFRLRCRYEPVREGDVPLFPAAAQLFDGDKPLLHSYAAIACLDASIRKFQPAGLFSSVTMGPGAATRRRTSHACFISISVPQPQSV